MAGYDFNYVLTCVKTINNEKKLYDHLYNYKFVCNKVFDADNISITTRKLNVYRFDNSRIVV